MKYVQGQWQRFAHIEPQYIARALIESLKHLRSLSSSGSFHSMHVTRHICSGLGIDLHPTGEQSISTYVSYPIVAESCVNVRAAIAGFDLHGGGSTPDHTSHCRDRVRPRPLYDHGYNLTLSH